MSSVSTPISRRRMLALAPAAIGGLVARPVRGAAAPPRILADEGLPSHFPHQDPALVRAIVGASHSDIDRVRALVEERPALARATWD